MHGISSERRDSSRARVPPVPEGHAVVYTRYDEDKAVVVHPRDFERLSALARDLDELGEVDRLAMTDLAARAHALEEASGPTLEDPNAIRSLLGL